MSGVAKGVILAIMILKIISPIDVCPGPIDDTILILIGLADQKGMRVVEDYGD